MNPQATVTTVPEFHLSLGAHARLEHGAEGLRVSARGQMLQLRAPTPALVNALERLTDGGATEVMLCEQALQSGEPSALFLLVGVLRALDASGVLQRRLVLDGRPMATLTPTASGFRFCADLPLSEGRRRLSPFAYLRADRGSMRVESPLGLARLDLHDPRAGAVAVALAEGRSLDDLKSLFPDLGGGLIEGLVILLQNVAALVDANDADELAPSAAGAMPTGWWEFHDLLFHMRSRRGRHDAPYGGTYRHETAAPPLIKPRPPGDIIPLFRPDLEQLRRTDAPFTEVLERRRSVRAYGPEPLTIEQLGEFLYRSARYQRILPADVTDYALRAAPSGGGLQELELYPVVAHCRGVEPGVYHYHPSEHELTRIAAPSPLFERLLEEAWITANRESPLNVYLQITARCERVFWKYESMAYALILKNLGALYATMYFVATAMGLAPCALGGGDSELFSTVAGLDACEEPAVGEFVLGTRRREHLT
jgi:SagB-type dehydrogenase family enzyme